MLPETAGRAGWTLDRANGVHETLFGLSFLIGPGVGGLLIATVGASGALIGTGIGFLIAAACVALLRGLPGSGRPDHAERPDGIWRGTREGLSFVLHEPLLRPLAILIMLVVALYYPVEGVILPVYFQELGSPGQLGAVLMVMSGGMVVGTLAYEPLVRRFTKRWLFVGSMLGSILALLGMAFLPPIRLAARRRRPDRDDVGSGAATAQPRDADPHPRPPARPGQRHRRVGFDGGWPAGVPGGRRPGRGTGAPGRVPTVRRRAGGGGAGDDAAAGLAAARRRAGGGVRGGRPLAAPAATADAPEAR